MVRLPRGVGVDDVFHDVLHRGSEHQRGCDRVRSHELLWRRLAHVKVVDDTAGRRSAAQSAKEGAIAAAAAAAAAIIAADAADPSWAIVVADLSWSLAVADERVVKHSGCARRPAPGSQSASHARTTDARP